MAAFLSEKFNAFLGSGSSRNVYQGSWKNNANVVIKHFQDDKLLLRESKILNVFCTLPKVLHRIEEANLLILHPVASRLSTAIS